MKNDLSQIELFVLNRILEEKSSNTIAKELGFSLKEVDQIRQSIYIKLDAKNGIGLLKKAIENNLYNNK